MSADCPKCLNGCGGARSDCPKNQPPVKPKRLRGRPKGPPQVRLSIEEIKAAAEAEERAPKPPPYTRGVPNKVGSKYKPHYAVQAAKLCFLGATYAELADFFEVQISTIKDWRGSEPNFNAALDLGVEAADKRVERALYSRALGHEYDAQKVFLNRDGEPVIVPYRESTPPDTVAAIFWLKNRKRAEWRDRPHDADNPEDKTITIKVIGGLPPEEE